MNIVVIGGGAAGFFGAITCAESAPGDRVILLEKSGKLLSKVRVSGGGRCNVTHSCFEPRQLSAFYPRGSRELISAFSRFQASDTVAWFESRGVRLKTEDDGRMFPVTDSSETIVRCLMQAAEQAGVSIRLNTGVSRISLREDGTFDLLLDSGSLHAHRVLVAAGGHPKAEAYQWLRELGHTIESPVPSLFTFNIPDKQLHELAGLSVSDALVKVQGSKLETRGPVLITHWGLSGPAVLKTSAWGARLLHERGYGFTAAVNWLPSLREEELAGHLQAIRQQESRKMVMSFSPFPFPVRLWRYLALKAGLKEEIRWADVSAKSMNRLKEVLMRAEFQVQGKTTFKEEFVTCGGVKLSEIDFKTMESRKRKGLYFAGEVIDVDGITGGFNFQNAWTTGWIAGKSMAG
jgi:predicted Rossmann fold flavoprotein